uniref:Dopa decarboxylase n=1 Tax=Panagrolaimus sp. JU765 TaxID=591449 RepID=A0AC34PZ61_9BILA
MNLCFKQPKMNTKPCSKNMDPEAFRKYGKEMIDIVADYWTNMRDRQPLPNVKPGFIWDMVPKEPPKEPENWENIFKDVNPVVLDNNTNWHHPHFFAYFSTACSYPSIIADILSGGIASIGFTWKSSPSMTELEMVTTDWIAKVIGLPEFFLNSDPGPGAGMIQSTASDATFVAILSARARAVSNYKSKSTIEWIFSTVNKTFPKLFRKDTVEQHKIETDPVITFENHDASVINKLVAYCSDQAHSSVDKGIMLAGVKMRKLKSIIGGPLKNHYVPAATLEAAIKEDRARGLIPFIYVATIGTTNTCGMDNLEELGPICNREKIWMHVDAAYAGSFAICPEMRYLINGIEYADSFNFNPHKALQINFDCSPMWFKDAKEATKYFNVEAEYLKHEYQAVASDYRHLQIALGRRFRSLKIWFVFRSLGIDYIQQILRTRIKLAEHFADLLSKNDAFELIVPTHLGLVCFRHKSNNQFNEKLLTAINDDHRIHLVGAKVHKVFFLRLAICSEETTPADIDFAYNTIIDVFSKLNQNEQIN